MRPFITTMNLARVLAPANIILTGSSTRRVECFFDNGDSVSRNVTINVSYYDLTIRSFATVAVGATATGVFVLGDGTSNPIPHVLVINLAAAASGGWFYIVTQWV